MDSLLFLKGKNIIIPQLKQNVHFKPSLDSTNSGL